jgi:hemolysin D
VLAADLSQLSATIASLEAQRTQKMAERDRLKDTIETQKHLIATLQERVDMRASLVASKSGAKAAVIDATETLQYQQTQLAIQQGQLASDEAGMAVFERDEDKTLQTFVSDNAQKLDDGERQASDYEQRLAKAVARTDHMTLKSPIAGIVQASTITNVGQVVTTGQEVMRIVPEDAALELEVYVLNRDIGFIKPGQEAVVKIESFPFTRYGTLTAHVTRVASDAIPEPDANQIEGDPNKSTANSGFAGAQRTQNLVFPVTLHPDSDHINVDGVDVPLSPGMATTVEVKTGSRRILEYIFSPLVGVTSEALKER